MAVTGYFIDEDWQYREVLLGFEPIYGTHSGVNLSNVLLSILRQHDIENRVFAITTDNASNNSTLFENLQQSISEETTLIRVPCLAHIIQLSLNELLGQMKANPSNETTETRWTEQRSQSARANIQKGDIANTLSKVSTMLNILSTTNIFIDSKPCYLCQCKPPAPGDVLQPPSCSSKAYANPGCEDTLEFYLSNATPCKETPLCLRTFLR